MTAARSIAVLMVVCLVVSEPSGILGTAGSAAAQGLSATPQEQVQQAATLILLGPREDATTQQLAQLLQQIYDSLSPAAQQQLLQLVDNVVCKLGSTYAEQALKELSSNPSPSATQVSPAIVILFVAAALIFIPSVFKSPGKIIFGPCTSQPGVMGAPEPP